MRARVNGTDHDFADDVTVRELLDDLGYDRPGVAAAMNGTVVPRVRWASTTVPDGAVLEVLTAVQGG
ncbi:sulfur carrier protein ThiS [Labedaea rhizosphaerae]|uniref:Sulfur carrier protein ThiS n=1 Tax=Labedaea rhizosphaerae TaxID=598644 RepID=A0A4R6SJW1_LABRH|nr:sulfur carrier protein ThiS [Labedaea rhizosphaerae]TDQ04626.1 sulfur carrier protein ThiS [Labedaea rhizosphaerae]